MTTSSLTTGSGSFSPVICRILAILLVLVLPLGLSCTPMDGNGGEPDELSGEIISLISNITLSGNQLLTIVYTAGASATSVNAFYVEVESTDPSAPTVGSEVVFAQNLPTSTTDMPNQTVSLQTGAIPEGIYRVGLNLSDASDSLKVLSLGTFRIASLPIPEFLLPNQNLSLLPGAGSVDVRASLGDPENAIQWRLFFIENGENTDGVPAGQLGEQIATGQSNEAIVTWLTTGLALGDYRIGISVTDSGMSVVATSEAGDEDRIVTVFNDFLVSIVEELPPPMPPLVTVSQPSGSQTLFAGETTLVQFSVTVREGPPSEQSVSVFYDFDRTPDTGDEFVFSDDLPISSTSAVFSVDLIELGDTVNIGVTANDGKNDPVTVYASGTVTFGTPAMASLECVEPSSLLAKKTGETINVSWQTTGISSGAAGMVDVFARRTDQNGNATGAEIEILEPSPLTTMSATWQPPQSGSYQVSVRIIFDDDPSNPLIDPCPNLTKITNQPNVIWMGELASTTPTTAGAVFEGVNFEDNAGSAFEGDEDFNGDGLDEMFIVGRYAKPDFVNPTGIGPGEVYMIRGREERYLGRFNLNSVAGPIIPGFVFTGIPVLGGGNETDGIASILVTRDSDGDNVGEVVFGFPYVLSTFAGPLDGPSGFCPLNLITARPFERGGAVIVSSLNSELVGIGADQLGYRCPLEFVGQIFDATQGALGNQFIVSPEPGEGELCSNESSWMEDRLTFFDQGDCPPEGTPGTQIVGCLSNFDPRITSPDDEEETQVHPRFGFDFRLADPYPCVFGIPCFPGDLRGSLVEGCPASDPDGADCDTDQVDPAQPICEQTISLIGGGGMETDCTAENASARVTLPLNEAWIEPRLGEIASGFYRERISGNELDEVINWNDILRTPGGTRLRSLVGCRIVGNDVGEAYGTSMTQSSDDLIVSSPLSSALASDGGIGFTVEDFEPWPGNNRGLPKFWQIPADLNFDVREYALEAVPPRPHQYLAGGFSHFGRAPGSVANSHFDTFGLFLIGDEGEQIRNIVGIADFNEDAREDIAVGSPLGDVNNNGTPDGIVYILFRRAETLEFDFDLADLKRDLDDVERLAGVLVREELDDEQRFGESITGGRPTLDANGDYTFSDNKIFDFNKDGVEDVVVGNPDGNNGTGEIIIIFGDRDLISQAEGIPIEDEGSTPGLLTRRQGARIRGIEPGSEFGFNVLNVGDVDGDGLEDLAIAAPNATPYYDSNITDTNDSLDPVENVSALRGVDRDLDGAADDITGPRGIPDGVVNANDQLRRAGLVYIILGSTDARDFAPNAASPMDISVSQLGTTRLDGFIVVGRRGERFATTDPNGMMPAVHRGDFLGGGIAGETSVTIPSSGVTIEYGGNTNKADDAGRLRGRPFGFGRAGDIDGDGRDDLLLGAQLADPRVDPVTGEGTRNGGEAYLLYGFTP